MPRVLLTEKLIDRAKPPRSDTTLLWDTALPGFGCRLHPSGRKGFVLQYRLPDGQQRKMSLGVVGVPFTLDEARARARDLLNQVREGDDPASLEANRKQLKEQTAAINHDLPRSYAVERVWAEFMRRHFYAKEMSAAYIANSESQFRRYVLPRWRGRDIRTITRKEVVSLLDRIVDQGKGVTANRVLAVLSKLFNWSLKRGIVESVPTSQMEKPGPERRRDRVLSDNELALVWHAAGQIPYPSWGPWFRLLILTGQRRTEAAAMRWQDIDLGDGSWTLSASQTKSSRAHLVPLSPPAVDLLRRQPSECTWVFTTTRFSHIRNFDNAKKLIDRSLGEAVEKWNIHDIRRTVATGLAKLGVQPHVIAAVLNHAPQGVTAQVYNRYSYVKEKRTALDKWAKHVLRLAQGNQTAAQQQAAE